MATASTTTHYQSVSTMSRSSYYTHRRSNKKLQDPLPSFEIEYPKVDAMVQKPLPSFEIEYSQAQVESSKTASNSYVGHSENLQIDNVSLTASFGNGKHRTHLLSPMSISDEHQHKKRRLEAPIHKHQWTATSLLTLVSKLYPDLFTNGLLSFHPPLEKLNAGLGPPGPMILILYAHTEQDACENDKNDNDSKTHDLPTFNLNLSDSDSEKRVLAQSPWCSSPSEALTSLASTLLADTAMIARLSARYNVLAHLFQHPVERIESVWRGMKLMIAPSSSSSSASSSTSSASPPHTPGLPWQSIHATEWTSRRLHLRAVDYTWSIEPLVEAFLLEMGRQEVREWIPIVEDGIGVLRFPEEEGGGEEGRKGLVQWYGEAARFLKEALVKVGGREAVRGVWEGGLEREEGGRMERRAEWSGGGE